MTRSAHRNSRGVFGMPHAKAFMRFIENMKSNLIAKSTDPMMKLNRAILASYIHHTWYDEASRTGWFAYCEGVGDEDVRAYAEREFGSTIELAQVIALRRFLESLFLTGVSPSMSCRESMATGLFARTAAGSSATIPHWMPPKRCGRSWRASARRNSLFMAMPAKFTVRAPRKAGSRVCWGAEPNTPDPYQS